MPPPKGPRLKKKDRPPLSQSYQAQAQSNLQSNPNYVAAQLQDIVQQIGQPGYSTAPGSGIVTINPKFYGTKDQPGIMANAPADPSQMSEAQKAIYNFYASSTPSQYQQQLQNFIESSPQAAAAYKERFPITSFIQNMVPMAVGAATGTPIGIMSALNKKRKEIAKEGNVLGAIASIPETVAAQFKKQPKDKNTSTQDKNIDIIKEELGLDYSTSGAPYDQIDELPAGSVATDATNAADILGITYDDPGFNTDFTYDPYSGPNAVSPNILKRLPVDDFKTQNLQATLPGQFPSSGAPMDTGFVPAPPATQQEISGADVKRSTTKSYKKSDKCKSRYFAELTS